MKINFTKSQFLIILVLLVASCARAPLRSKEDAMRMAKIVPIAIDKLPPESFISALKIHVSAMKNSPMVSDPMIFGDYKIAKDKYIKALEEIFNHQDNWQAWISANFNWLEVYGLKNYGEVLTTGYYEPIIKGSRQPTEIFSQALYMPPKNVNIERKFIDVDHIFDGLGLELAWVDPLDAFFFQIQGSGIVEFVDGDRIHLGFAAKNNLPYRPIGKFLKNVIPEDQMSMQKIRAYLKSIPKKEQEEILIQNPSYVFFKKIDTNAITYSGMEVLPDRTIATDYRFFPKGALAFLDINEAIFKSSTDEVPCGWQSMPRFVFDQDTGGAIKGGGHIDLYFGQGDAAAQKAGVMKQVGKLYYLIPK
jgi:membrane-bound lytic murein transglycosylase A